MATDARKNRAVEAAGMRLVRIPAGPFPRSDELRRLIQGSDRQLHAATAGSAKGAHRDKVRKPIAGYAAVAVVVLFGCIAYAKFSAKSATPIVTAALTPTFSINSAPRPAMPVTPQAMAEPMKSSAIQQAEQKRLDDVRAMAGYEAAAKLESRRQAAWAAYYRAPASCEHPASWADQVECGNQFIRAKKEFEKDWQTQLASGPVSSMAR